MAPKETTPMPYPDRFYAAVQFVAQRHQQSNPISDDLLLLLFALHKQVTNGPCDEAKPWTWNVIETAKWEAWNKLGDMSKSEAMRHYVVQLEQNHPEWSTVGKEPATETEIEAVPGAHETESAEKDEEAKQRQEETLARQQKIKDATADGSWSTPYLSNASKPWPRYEHGVALARDQMYVFGGNCTGGRYMNDMWSFDFATLSWTSLSQQGNADAPAISLPPIAGHSVIPWNDTLLIVGGHVKTKDMTEELIVRSFDLDSASCSILKTFGKAPKSRGGHSATVFGDKVYIFGGEDVSRRPLNDLHVLNLKTLEWKDLSSAKNAAPTARSAHVATSYLDRYLIIFGGGSMATCFDDIVVYDSERQRWHTPTIRGRKPSPRAGHSASLLNNCWYIVGGGNNAAGCTDMAYFDLSQFNIWPTSAVTNEDGTVEDGYPEGPDLDDLEYEAKWAIVGTIPERSYLASEGMSLVAIEDSNVLVAFGGYNGRRSNAVSLFRPKNEQPVKQYSLQSTLSAQLGSELGDVTPHGERDQVLTEQIQSLQAKLDQMTTSAASAKEASSQEISIMRRQLVSAQALLQERDEALSQSKDELNNERAKTLKLEAENSELRVRLEKAAQLEKELEIARRMKHPPEAAKNNSLW